MSTKEQIGIAIALLAFLAVGTWFGGPLIPFGLLGGSFVILLAIRTPFNSIIALVLVNMLISLRPKEDLSGGAPTALDMILGVVIVCIDGYWLLRLRVFENRDWSRRKSDLVMTIFFAWSALITLIGVFLNNSSPAFAVREILNIVPLLIVPTLYERSIDVDSKQESRFFALAIVVGLVINISNILLFKRNVAASIYLYQAGRVVLDLAAIAILTIVMASILMRPIKGLKLYGVILFLLLSMISIAVSFTRALYVLIPAGVLVALLFGNRDERVRGIRRLTILGLIASVGIGYYYISSKIFRLLFINFVLRFASSEHLSTDLSMRARYVEWNSVMQNIEKSPVIGYGFGHAYRLFDILQGHHSWNTFSHNGFLYLAFKTGIVGLMLFLVANALVILKGFQLARRTDLSDRSRIVARAALAFILVILGFIYTSPMLDSKIGVTWFALAWGYLHALENKHSVNRIASET